MVTGEYRIGSEEQAGMSRAGDISGMFLIGASAGLFTYMYIDLST